MAELIYSHPARLRATRLFLGTLAVFGALTPPLPDDSLDRLPWTLATLLVSYLLGVVLGRRLLSMYVRTVQDVQSPKPGRVLGGIGGSLGSVLGIAMFHSFAGSLGFVLATIFVLSFVVGFTGPMSSPIYRLPPVGPPGAVRSA